MRDKAPPRNQREGVWEERNHGRPGMKCATLYRNTAGDPAIYEFAVRRIKDLARRKTVVYHKVHGGFEGKPWDSTLLKGDRVRMFASISRLSEPNMSNYRVDSNVNVVHKLLA